MTPRLLKALCLGIAFLSCAAAAHAQGGSCRDPYINQAYNTTMGRAPQGSGNTGECNINLYGAGSWTGLEDLKICVVASKYCSDPWIGQIYKYLYNRRPSAAECTISNYGGGQWSSYVDLTNKVQAFQQGGPARTAAQPIVLKAPNPGDLIVNSGGDLVDFSGRTVLKNGSYVINTNGSNIVAQGAGNIVAQGAGNIVAQGAGNLRPGDVIQGGAASLGYAVQSVGGKRVIKGNVIHH